MNEQPPREQVLRLREADLVYREVQGETVVLDLSGSIYFSTNEVGGVLWRALAEGATQPQLVDALLDEFEVPRERAERDVEKFVSDCAAAGLLQQQPTLE